MLVCSFAEGFEGSCRHNAVGKCYPTLSFPLLAFILVGSAINPHGLGHKANSDSFKTGAIPPGHWTRVCSLLSIIWGVNWK